MPPTNRHHRYWPRRSYKTSMERSFRNLPCNVVVMRIEDHCELHATTRPPKKPRPQVMAQAVDNHKLGLCSDCFPRG